EKQVGKLAGVESVTVHFATARIEVDHDESKTSVDDIVAAIANAGYTATPSAFCKSPLPPPGPRQAAHSGQHTRPTSRKVSSNESAPQMVVRKLVRPSSRRDPHPSLLRSGETPRRCVEPHHRTTMVDRCR